jgi:hypothetical protein
MENTNTTAANHGTGEAKFWKKELNKATQIVYIEAKVGLIIRRLTVQLVNMHIRHPFVGSSRLWLLVFWLLLLPVATSLASSALFAQ